VLAGWNMWDVLRDKAQKSGKLILRVNVDETALTLGFAGHSGTLKQKNKHEPCLLQDIAPTRGTFSNIAFICDDSEVQVLLPQIIVGNESLLPKKVLDDLSDKLPPNVYLCREKSGWITAAMFAVALQWLARATQHLSETHLLVVLLDCAPIHLHELVWQEAKKLNMALCLIPNGCTWLLQPLDTHVFRKYKAYIRQEYNRQQAASQQHKVPVGALILMVCKAIRFVLQGFSWATSFDNNGYAQDGRMVSDRVLTSLRLETVSSLQDSPLLELMPTILPRRAIHLQRYMQTGFPMDVGTHTPPGERANVDPSIDGLAMTAGRDDVGRHHNAASQTHEAHSSGVGEDWMSRLRPRTQVPLTALHEGIWLEPGAPSGTVPPAPAAPCPSWTPRLSRLPPDPLASQPRLME
jgi:hypothetical protein